MRKDKDNDKDIAKAIPTSSLLGIGLIAFDDLDRWFDNLLSCRWPQPDRKFPIWLERECSLSQNFSRIDIIEHDNEIKVRAAQSSVKKANPDVSISNQTVTIRAFSKQENETKNEAYYCQAISRGEFFQRTLSYLLVWMARKLKHHARMTYLTLPYPNQNKISAETLKLCDVCLL
ncbi:Hsp20/alpha crystallin family protein [Methylobacter sp. Wu1]|uniref:Hsp20/alpha crystallin family protein n=1 Tax=Methylobacter sp. Wu1 TaxID=3119359 RepID=UPI002F957F6A